MVTKILQLRSSERGEKFWVLATKLEHKEELERHALILAGLSAGAIAIAVIGMDVALRTDPCQWYSPWNRAMHSFISANWDHVKSGDSLTLPQN